MTRWYPMSSFGEDVELTATASGTRVRWTFTYAAVPLLRPVLWLGGPLTNLATGGIVRGLADQVGARA